MRTCNHIGRLCEELGVSRKTLEKWRRQMEARHEAEPVATPLTGETLDEENRRLKRALAEKVLEVDFLQAALHNIEARRWPSTDSGGKISTPRCERRWRCKAA